MPRNPKRDQEHRKERSELILSAAVELFAKKGLSATKISDIAKKSGMSHGLVYNYFRSKEEIYISLIDKSLKGFKKDLEYVVSQPLNGYEKIVLLLHNININNLEEALFHQIFVDQFLTSDAVSEVLKSTVRAVMAANVELVASIFAEGQASGHFIEGDPRELAYYFLTYVQAMILAEARGLPFDGKNAPDNLLRLFMRKT
ncbi:MULTISPECIES: TetR/AcrR family transcriptional regulator [unclassified Paenibacillus]|uniref:TetR/AcrR family transcriptional regulator n=1 Tax=unclassified Paenibacillus TaxID=185978 RepID=UPI001AE6E5B7|nr:MULTISPECIES: TetR/AcrR family transcriptional regulator [unclassified Paenibacillus]MBP1157219.1 AcrR family transcriptional regulator [Paenibacillus sp. PvP091]MBP1172042.1 AcrR family transcriptional regulator [Paenibacillus sp. PvR098]MBP2438423.1 AcrR family transcriptional regulator [Paenibacillus sp. PvP052]